MLTRREAILASAVPLIQTARSRRRPNLLFLMADDHAGYVLGAAGDRLAETPNLDRLASEGTRFAQHFCNSPVCTPSRQSLLTGQLPHMAGVTRLQTQLSPDKPTLAKQLQTAGYTTGVIGKMHFNQPGRQGLHGFDYMMTERELSAAWADAVKPRPIPPEIATKPVWRPFKDPARIWLNAEKLPYSRYEEDMKATFQVRQAEAFLEQNQDKQFALWVSFHEPHSPFDFPVEDRNRFAPGRFPVPKVGPQDGGQIPLIFRDLSPAEKQGIIAAYYTSVNYLDRNLGRVIAQLRRLNLEDDTLIVYLSDHGYSLGQHGRFEKHCGYRPASHVPFILRWPGRIRQGAITDFTEHVDVAPTLIDLLGLDPLPVQHGQTLRPYLEGKRIERPRQTLFGEYLENEEAYARTDRYSFVFCSGKRTRTDGYETENPTPGRYVRLYDLKSDPGEFDDISAKHPEVVREMRDFVLERFRATHTEAAQEPPGATPDEALEFYLRPRDA
jgi:arylsulfatase A-like enzyme